MLNNFSSFQVLTFNKLLKTVTSIAPNWNSDNNNKNKTKKKHFIFLHLMYLSASPVDQKAALHFDFDMSQLMEVTNLCFCDSVFSKAKLSHHHSCLRSKEQRQPLQNWGCCLSTNNPLNVYQTQRKEENIFGSCFLKQQK